jgi:hypothetical protein
VVLGQEALLLDALPGSVLPLDQLENQLWIQVDRIQSPQKRAEVLADQVERQKPVRTLTIQAQQDAQEEDREASVEQVDA